MVKERKQGTSNIIYEGYKNPPHKTQQYENH